MVKQRAMEFCLLTRQVYKKSHMSILKICQKKKKRKKIKYAKNRYNMSHEKKQKNMSDEKKLKTKDCLRNYHKTIRFNLLY